MLQVRLGPQRTDRSPVDPHAAACAAYAELTRDVALPEPLGTYFRKARSTSQAPNPLARVFRDAAQAFAHGASEANLRILGVAFTTFVDGLCGRGRALDFEALHRGIELENAENLAEPAVLAGSRDPATLRAFARAKRREAIHDLLLADAADVLASQRVHA